MIFPKLLIQWYLQNKRDLPWRNTKNPYYIWLSEIILQQTRVDQGLSYYSRFITEFPTVYSLAEASEEHVLKLWQGLGYYSRARNLHYSAKFIVEHFDGNFPTKFEDILSLKGVGDYTASAIASICYDEPHAVVDGNVYRVLARYFNIDTPINSTKGIKEFKELAQNLIQKDQPGTYNQAIMEYGARVCKPQNPSCDYCVLKSGCLARANAAVQKLPLKIKKGKVRVRYFNYVVIHTGAFKTCIQKRTSGIWKNLYEFPLIESTSEIEESELTQLKQFKDLFENNVMSVKLFNEESIVHKLSHQHIYTKFWIVKTSFQFKSQIPIDHLEHYPVPVLIDNFLKQYQFN